MLSDNVAAIPACLSLGWCLSLAAPGQRRHIYIQIIVLPVSNKIQGPNIIKPPQVAACTSWDLCHMEALTDSAVGRVDSW